MQPDVAPSTEYIVYACPTETLGGQIEAFMRRSACELGANSAHPYPPHVTLTGFFHDTADACSLYGDALHRARDKVVLENAGPGIRIRKRKASPRFIGLRIESPMLLSLAANFACQPEIVARPEAIRLKHDLHLSLAYGFPGEQFSRLKAMAASMIDLEAAVRWELRFYERRSRDQWVLHRQWELP